MVENNVCKEIRNLNFNLLETIAKIANNSTLNNDYQLLIRSIVYKLKDFCELYSQSSFDSANIILRAAFEEIVLFEYLLNKPDKLERYKLDSEIDEFRLHAEFFEDDYITREELNLKHGELSEEAKKSITIKWGPKTRINDNETEREWKCLAQQTRYLIRELLEMNSKNSIFLKEGKKVYYTNSCLYTHSTYSRIRLKKVLDIKERLDEIINYSIFSLELANIIFLNIEGHVEDKKLTTNFKYAYIKFHDYIKDVKIIKENSIVKESIQNCL